MRGRERLLCLDFSGHRGVVAGLGLLHVGDRDEADLESPLRAAGVAMTLIGGADVAVELDARRAIAQGTEVALAL